MSSCVSGLELIANNRFLSKGSFKFQVFIVGITARNIICLKFPKSEEYFTRLGVEYDVYIFRSRCS